MTIIFREAVLHVKEQTHFKIIDRAKEILMREQDISEMLAYKILRKAAMDRRRTMKDVAELLIYSRGKK